MCVKREWLEHILSGRKTVELRTQTLRHKLAAASEAGKWLVVGLINDQTMYSVWCGALHFYYAFGRRGVAQ